MVCSNCGYQLAPEDKFCGGCGAYLTDAPAEQAAPIQGSQPQANQPQANQPQYNQPQYYPPQYYESQGQQTQYYEPQGNDHWVPPYVRDEEYAPPRRGPGPRIIAAGVAAVLVLALLVWAFTRGGDDDPDQAATPAVTQTTGAPTTTEPPSTPTDGTESPTETATATATETATADPTRIELAPSAAQCSNVGSIAVYRGNDQTSCPFAENVARAYAALVEPVTGPVTLSDVASPVTGQTYSLTCEFTSPVRCSGGDNAVVYLSPSS